MKKVIIKTAGILLFATPVIAYSANADGSDKMTQEKMDKIMKETKVVSDRLEKERVAEKNRDKTHDYRLKTSKDTSVGADHKSVSVIHTF